MSAHVDGSMEREPASETWFRVPMVASAAVGNEPYRLIGDGGEQVNVVDVVGGAHAELREAIVDMHRRAFPQYSYVAPAIEADALADPHRRGLTVHQYVLTIDGRPAGFIRGASNLVRRTAVIEYLAVEPPFRDLRIEGLRTADWLMRNCQRQFRIDTGDECIGCTGEVAHQALRLFVEYGWVVLPCSYSEPLHGWHWRERGVERRDVALIWLPNPEHPSVFEPADVIGPVAASYLLDTYDLPADLDWVAAVVGEHGRCDRAAH